MQLRLHLHRHELLDTSIKKLIRVEHSQSLVRAQILAIQLQLKIWRNTKVYSAVVSKLLTVYVTTDSKLHRVFTMCCINK